MGKSSGQSTRLTKAVLTLASILNQSNRGRQFVNLIIAFFEQFFPLSSINSRLCSEKPTETQSQIIKLLFLRTVLPLEILRSLDLFPPEGVSFERWQCLAGPCSSTDQLRCLNFSVINQIRQKIGLTDDLPSDYYKKFQSIWCDKSRGERKRKGDGSFSPLMLFPVRLLPPEHQDIILNEYPLIKGQISELFLCGDHFYVKPDSDLSLPLRSATIFNYSIEYLTRCLCSGEVELKITRKGTAVVPYLKTLLNLGEGCPSYTDPRPFNCADLGALNMENNPNFALFSQNTPVYGPRGVDTPPEKDLATEIGE